MVKLTTEQFIAKAIKVHGNKYDYSKVIYINVRTKIDIICKIHGKYSVLPRIHLRSCCPMCARSIVSIKKTMSLCDFITRATSTHGNKYNYSDVVYINHKTPVKIFCNKCNKYYNQIPVYHIRGKGCSVCGGNKPKTTNEYIEMFKKIHTHGTYIYDKTIVNGSRSKIVVACKKHGDFKLGVSNHLAGNGCPLCKLSKGEQAIKSCLEELNIPFNSQHVFSDCMNVRKLAFDFYIPSLNMCIEYDGIQHFEPIDYFGGQQTFDLLCKRDMIKNEYCYVNNICLLRICYKKFNHIKDIITTAIIEHRYPERVS